MKIEWDLKAQSVVSVNIFLFNTNVKEVHWNVCNLNNFIFLIVSLNKRIKIDVVTLDRKLNDIKLSY